MRRSRNKDSFEHNIYCMHTSETRTEAAEKDVLLAFESLQDARNFIKFINANFHAAIFYSKSSCVYYVYMFITDSLYKNIINRDFDAFKIADCDEILRDDIVMLYYNSKKYASSNAKFNMKRDTLMKKMFLLREYALKNSENFEKYFLQDNFYSLIDKINKINAHLSIYSICKSKFQKNFRNMKISIAKLTRNSFYIEEVLKTLEKKNKNNILLKNRLYYITIYKYVFYIKTLFEVYNFYNIESKYDIEYVKNYILNFLRKYVKNDFEYNNYVEFVNNLFYKHVFYKQNEYFVELRNKFAIQNLRKNRIFVSLYLKNNRRLSNSINAKNYFVKNKRYSNIAFLRIAKHTYKTLIREEKIRKFIHFVVFEQDYVTIVIKKKYARRVYKFFNVDTNECYYVRLHNKYVVQKNVNNNFVNIKHSDFIVELYKLTVDSSKAVYNNNLSVCKSLFNKSIAEVTADDLKKMLYKQKYLYLQNENNKHDYISKIMYIYTLAVFKNYHDVIKIFDEDFLHEKTYVALDVLKTMKKYSSVIV